MIGSTLLARRHRPRRPATVATMLATAVATAVLAPAALAASLSSPATAAIGSQVTVTASNLISGRYQLFLAYTRPNTQGTKAINCTAPISAIKTIKKSGKLSGKLPTTLTCRNAAGAKVGTEPVSAGRYDFAVYSPVGANASDGNKSFQQRSVTITG